MRTHTCVTPHLTLHNHYWNILVTLCCSSSAIMSSRIYHDSPKKNCFIGAVQAGQTIIQAAASFGIPQSTASDLWHKFQQTGSTHSRPQSGWPIKISDHTKQTVTHAAKIQHRKTMKISATLSHQPSQLHLFGRFLLKMDFIKGRQGRLYSNKGAEDQKEAMGHQP